MRNPPFTGTFFGIPTDTTLTSQDSKTNKHTLNGNNGRESASIVQIQRGDTFTMFGARYPATSQIGVAAGCMFQAARLRNPTVACSEIPLMMCRFQVNLANTSKFWYNEASQQSVERVLTAGTSVRFRANVHTVVGVSQTLSCFSG
jgi:endonuclease YncB( thermonuclease family)